MATLTPSVTVGQKGKAISLIGDGFTANATVTLSVNGVSYGSQIKADASGLFGTDDQADRATTTLTISANPVAAEAVTIGAVTYTFRASVATTANEILVAGTAAASLQNLKDAINLTGTTAQYGSLTVIHPTVTAGVITATTLQLYAKAGGTGGNSLASTETLTNGSFPGATFNSGTPGAAATGVSSFLFTPEHAGMFVFNATDGTNSASCSIPVYTA